MNFAVRRLAHGAGFPKQLDQVYCVVINGKQPLPLVNGNLQIGVGG